MNNRIDIEEMQDQYNDLLVERNALIDDNNKMDDEIDGLKQENAKLKEENETLVMQWEAEHEAWTMECEENAKLKEALQRCSPWHYVLGEFPEDVTSLCTFCGGNETHFSDCEYLKLCGGEQI